jgi:hypothetical protein
MLPAIRLERHRTNFASLMHPREAEGRAEIMTGIPTKRAFVGGHSGRSISVSLLQLCSDLVNGVRDAQAVCHVPSLLLGLLTLSKQIVTGLAILHAAI